MELRTLSNFNAVVQHDSVSLAAAAVNITQPALSRQLQALERELGLTLFDRSPGRISLNSAGRELLPWVVEVLASAERLTAVAASLRAGALENIEIASPLTTEFDVIAPFVATFGEGDPVPSVVDLAGRSDMQALEAGVDLVVGGAMIGDGPQRMTLCEVPVWAYCRKDHPWANQDWVSLADLTGQPLLVLDGASRSRQILADAIQVEGLATAALIECTGPQIAQALVVAGRGIAVLTDDPHFDLHPLRIRGRRRQLTMTLTAAWSPQHHAADALVDVAARMREFCLERFGTTAVD